MYKIQQSQVPIRHHPLQMISEERSLELTISANIIWNINDNISIIKNRDCSKKQKRPVAVTLASTKTVYKFKSALGLKNQNILEVRI
jgi:hypothetical protein